MKRISCVIFDLDGTLTQTNELIFATFNHVAEKYVGKQFTPREITAMFGPPELVAIERLVGADRLDNAMDDFYSFYEKHHPKMASAYTGVKEILNFIKSHGLILAIFTGKGRRSALITLETIGIRNYFDLIITGDDVDNHKPSADGIRKIMKAFGLQPEQVLMVGDAVADVKAAQEAGVSIVAVVWDSYGKEKVLEMKTDYLFHNIEEFSTWLKVTLSTNGERSN
jgi:pyrophosphatase PpaX